MCFYQPSILQQAYEWLCQRRKNYSPNSDIWHLRSNWETEKVKLIAALKAENYQFQAVRKVVAKDKTVHVWAAKDALVLKMLTIYLRRKLDPILWMIARNRKVIVVCHRCQQSITHGRYDKQKVE